MTANQKMIGHARVSTDVQNLDMQRNALTKAKCTEIFLEKASGKNVAMTALGLPAPALRLVPALHVDFHAFAEHPGLAFDPACLPAPACQPWPNAIQPASHWQRDHLAIAALTLQRLRTAGRFSGSVQQ